MKKLMFIFSLLLVTVVAQAQFEKGKWFVNPSVTGLNLSYNTQTEKAHFGIEANGGAFLVDNVALLLRAGAQWQGGGSDGRSCDGSVKYCRRCGSRVRSCLCGSVHVQKCKNKKN